MNHLVKQERGDLNYSLPASARCSVITEIIFTSEAEDRVLVCTCATVMGARRVQTGAWGTHACVRVCPGERVRVGLCTCASARVTLTGVGVSCDVSPSPGQPAPRGPDSFPVSLTEVSLVPSLRSGTQ